MNTSVDAAARRETARSSDGRFGIQQHGESAVGLAEAAAPHGNCGDCGDELSEHEAGNGLCDYCQDEYCSECGSSLDDGEGWNGLCGNCADRSDSGTDDWD